MTYRTPTDWAAELREIKVQRARSEAAHIEAEQKRLEYQKEHPPKPMTATEPWIKDRDSRALLLAMLAIGSYGGHR